MSRVALPTKSTEIITQSRPSTGNVLYERTNKWDYFAIHYLTKVIRIYFMKNLYALKLLIGFFKDNSATFKSEVSNAYSCCCTTSDTLTLWMVLYQYCNINLIIHNSLKYE